jgi:probable HAF family extracellular repeat protein
MNPTAVVYNCKATKFAKLTFLVAILIGVLGIQTSAQEKAKQHRHYKFVDLGTLGGPHSYGSINGEGFGLLNNSGVVASFADTDVPDPNAPGFFLAHAAKWNEDGVITDLGTLPGGNFSAAGSINERGWSTGQSLTDIIDPVLGAPELRAVLWRGGRIINLGTLGRGTESLGVYINDAGQVIGFSTISLDSDPFGFIGFPTHTFIWEDGKKRDIGTLGGLDTFPSADCGNQPKGLVVGQSTTTTTTNPDTGVPTADPFLWEDGKMIDLGTLGGSIGAAQCANHHRQVIGSSSLSANPAACLVGGPGCHAFFWERGVMKDLGTLGGPNSEAIWLNEAGDVAGSADLPGEHLHDAVLWRHGKIHDLGTIGDDLCSRGRSINSRGQVVGGSSDCFNFLHAFIWETGGPMVDLNTLIPPDTGFQLTNAFNINDRGEILAKAAPVGFTPQDDADLGHLALLIPCEGDDHECRGNEDAASSLASHSAAIVAQTSATSRTPNRKLTPAENVAAWRAAIARRYHVRLPSQPQMELPRMEER